MDASTGKFDIASTVSGASDGRPMLAGAGEPLIVEAAPKPDLRKPGVSQVTLELMAQQVSVFDRAVDQSTGRERMDVPIRDVDTLRVGTPPAALEDGVGLCVDIDHPQLGPVVLTDVFGLASSVEPIGGVGIEHERTTGSQMCPDLGKARGEILVLQQAVHAREGQDDAIEADAERERAHVGVVEHGALTQPGPRGGEQSFVQIEPVSVRHVELGEQTAVAAAKLEHRVRSGAGSLVERHVTGGPAVQRGVE